MKNNKRVLITGGAGFLGPVIVKQLIAKGYDVIAIVRKSSDLSQLTHPQIQLIHGDIRDEKVLEKAVKQSTIVIHAAATLMGSWNQFYETNIQATENLIKLSVLYNIQKFIYVSSISVYAHSKYKSNVIIDENYPYEDDEFHSNYSKSKMLAEKIALQYQKEKDLPGIIFRSGSIYGPKGALFPARMGMPIGSSKVLLFGNTKTNMPLVYVENVAKAIVNSLSIDSMQGECFNLVEDFSITRKEYFHLLKKDVSDNVSKVWMPLWFMQMMKFGLRVAFKFLGQKAPLSDLNLKVFSTSFQYSNEKIKKHLSNDFVKFSESLDRTMEWHKRKLTPKRSKGIVKGKITIPEGKKLKIGIVGCGNISKTHLSFINKLNFIDSISVADPQEEAINAISSKYPQVKKYKDYKEMIHQERPDVVHVLTPPQFHCDVAMTAIQNQCHVLVEKPMAADADASARLVDEASDNNVKLCVMHNHLYDDVSIEAREIMAQGVLGKITYVDSWYGIQFKENASRLDPKSHWKYSLPGSVFQDYLPHALYVLTDIIGPVSVQHAEAKYLGRTPGVSCDELKILLANQQHMGSITISLSTSPRHQYLKVYGTSGTLEIDFLNQYVFLKKELGPLPKTISLSFSSAKQALTLNKSAIRNMFNLIRGKYDLLKGSDRLIQLFYRSIIADEPPPVPGTEGLEVMKIMDDVWKKI